MQAKFQIKFLAYCGKKYGAPDFYVNKSQVYNKHLKVLMTTNKPKKKESIQDFVVFNLLFFTNSSGMMANAKFV